MKVVLLSSASSIHTIQWANYLTVAGVEVHVISQHPLIGSLDKSVHLHLLPFRGVLGYFSMVPRVKRLLHKINPDILNAHYASGYATTARFVGFCPTLVSVWGSDVYKFPYASPLHRALVKSNLIHANGVASTSQCMAVQVRRLFPSIDEVFITPFGVNLGLYPMNASSSDDGTITVGTVKTLADTYGIDILISAFSLLVKRLQYDHPDLAGRIRLRIVGDGPKKSQLQKQVKDLGLESVTEFVGHVSHDRVPSELRRLDIYVALSRQESFGVAVIEAGAAERPVVVSRVGGLPEVVLDEITGLIVPPEDPQSAAEALHRLVIDPKLRAKMGAAAREHVQQNYSWTECVTKMKDAYRTLINEEQGARISKSSHDA